MTEKWQLTKVSILNFKSISVKQGFTILTGANGCGKSNILEAILFGLGEVPQKLRVSTLDDLRSSFGSDTAVNVKKGKTSVELTFLSKTQNRTTMIGSSIIEQQRMYMVASKKVTKRMFDQYLQTTLGFASEMRCFSIQQFASQQLVKASPKQLFSFICDAAGTQVVLAARDEARIQIKQAQLSLGVVKSTIQKYESEVAKDMKSKKVFAQLKQTKKQLRQACENLQQTQYLTTLCTIFKTLTLLQEGMEMCISEDAERLNLREKLLKLVEQHEVAVSAGMEHDNAFHTHQHLTSELELDLRVDLCHHQQLLSAGETKKTELANKRKNMEKQADEHNEQLSRVKQQIAALEQFDIPEARKSLRFWEDQLTTDDKNCTSSTYTSTSPDKGKRHRLLRQKRKLQFSLQRNESEILALTSECEVLEVDDKALEEHMRDLQDGLKSAEGRLISLKEALLSIPLDNSHDEADKLDGREDLIFASKNRLNTARDTQADVQHLLNEARDERSQFRRRKLRIGLDLDAEGLEPHNLGFLADMLVVTLPAHLDEDIEAKRFFLQGLQHVIGPCLGVLLCFSQQDAIAMIQQYQALQNGSSRRSTLRIWPLETLSVDSHRSDLFSSCISFCQDPTSESTFSGWKAVDPVTCFSMMSPLGFTASEKLTLSLRRAVYKACQNWILTANDSIANSIMVRLASAYKSTHGKRGAEKVGCVSPSGNRHVIGGMTIRSHDERAGIGLQQHTSGSVPGLPITYLKEYQSLNQRVVELQSRLDKVKATVQLNSQEHIYLVRLFQAKQELEEMQTTLEESERACREVKQKLAWKNEKKATIQSLVVTTSKQLEELLSILDATDDSSIDLIDNKQQEFSDTLISSYNCKQLQQSRDVASKLDRTLDDLDQQKSAVAELLEDRKEIIEGLIWAQKENSQSLSEHVNQVICLRQRVAEKEKKIANFDIYVLEEHRLKSQKLTDRLQSEKDSLRDNIAQSEVTYSNLKTDCIRYAGEYMEQVSSLDNEDSGNQEASHSSEQQNRVFVLQQKLRVRSESTLLDHSAIADFKLLIVNEVQECFSENGKKFSQSLLDDATTLQQRTSLEAHHLIELREKLTLKCKCYQRDFVSLQFESTTAKKEKEVSLAPTKRKYLLRQQNNNNNNKREDEEYDNCNRSEEHISFEDVNLEAYELQAKQRTLVLESLLSKFEKITTGIAVLEGGLGHLQQQLITMHKQVYLKIRQRFSDYFDDLVGLKDVRCDLVPAVSQLAGTTSLLEVSEQDVGNISATDDLEHGFRMILVEESLEKDNNMKCEGTRPVKKNHQEQEVGRRKLDVRGLSGGQQALLGLALLFACALSSHRSPVFFLDEVDSSLDESNQNAIAKAVTNIFMTNTEQQVICVSHNINFQRHTANRISVVMKDGHTTMI